MSKSSTVKCVDLSRPSIPYILTFLCSISQEGVVEEKDVMQPSSSIKVTEGKLTVIHSGTLCNKIFFLCKEDNDWGMSY